MDDIQFDTFSNKLAELRIRLEALDKTALRFLSRFDEGLPIGAVSMLKQSEPLVQDMDHVLSKFLVTTAFLDSVARQEEPIGPAYTDMAASGTFHHRGFTIAGGTSEIQRNIIARQVLDWARVSCFALVDHDDRFLCLLCPLRVEISSIVWPPGATRCSAYVLRQNGNC